METEKQYESINTNLLKTLQSPMTVKDMGGSRATSQDFAQNQAIKGWFCYVLVTLDDLEMLNLPDNDIARIIRMFNFSVEGPFKELDSYLGSKIDRYSFLYLFSCPFRGDLNDIFTAACQINTSKKLLSKILAKEGKPSLDFSLIISCGIDLIVSKKSSFGSIDNLDNCFFAGQAYRNLETAKKFTVEPRRAIVVDSCVYENISSFDASETEKNSSLFEQILQNNSPTGFYYTNAVITDFNTWIEAQKNN